MNPGQTSLRFLLSGLFVGQAGTDRERFLKILKAACHFPSLEQCVTNFLVDGGQCTTVLHITRRCRNESFADSERFKITIQRSLPVTEAGTKSLSANVAHAFV